MGKKLFVLLLLLNAVSNAQPGKEAWQWVFGQAYLDFSSGTAVPVAAGIPGNIPEAVAVMSDQNTGQLLFYTNGVTVCNKTYNIMMGGVGLMGHVSTTQTLIVPHPGNTNLYYIITADKEGGSKGVRYSVVDMTQMGGLGKVTIKNKILTPAPATEKITAVRHCNGVDYWVITHSFNSDAFNAYLVDASGIDTVPVISNAGTFHKFIAPFNDEAIGYMKASPNGSKLALGISSDSLPLLEILDINNLTGVISNPITIKYQNMIGPYGVSFSPDNSKLYVSTYPTATVSVIYQYDLSSGVPSAIIASQILLAQKVWYSGINGGMGTLSALQLGPDGKIYIARNSEDTLAVINNPNMSGISCNFQMNGLVMGPPSWHWAMAGLPNFIDANYAGIQISIPDVQQCNTFTTTTLDAGPGFSNYFWSTGAGTQTISISSPGKYWVTVTSAQGCTRTDTVDAYLLDPLKMDTLACDTFHANVTQNGVLQYSWYDGNNQPTRDFTQSGNYYVDINYVSGCAIRDSIDLTVVPSPDMILARYFFL